MEIRTIGEDELPRWVEAMRAGRPETDTIEGYLDWKRQARETVWLLASEREADVGVAIGIDGWHSPPGVARGEVRVAPENRRRGHGTAVLRALSEWALAQGCDELTGPIAADDAASLEWARRRGFDEIGRDTVLALDLAAIETPAVDPPPGVEIVAWAERPGLERGMYAVAREAYVDVPGEEDTVVEPFERWLAMDMQGAGDRPDATFMALRAGKVVGYAKLSLSLSRPTVAMHDMTGVLRAERGRGIAGALKRAEIAWAKQEGYERLETFNEERNTPIHRLNTRHGYSYARATVTVRGPALR